MARPRTKNAPKARPAPPKPIHVPADALADGMVRIRTTIGRVVDVPALDLDDILAQYPGTRVVAGAHAGSYAQIRAILEKFDADQMRQALDRLEQDVPEWVSPDFMASKIIEQGGFALLESMFPEGGRGLSFDIDPEEEVAP